MKIDSAIKDFYEKFDRDAIESIDKISKDYGLTAKGSTIKAFNISEGFDVFDQYLRGYAEYKIKFLNDEKASPQSVIKESVNTVVNDQLFKETNVLYSKLPTFVESYINGINKLMKTIDDVKGIMTESDVPPEDIGDVNDFVDQFIHKLNESFYPAMDRILWASGYNSHKALQEWRKNTTQKPIFL